MNNACAPATPYTGSCTLCHLSDRGAPTPAKTAYLAGGTTLTDFFCPAAPPPPACTDSDGDTYAVEGGNCGPVDCNDANPAVNPAAAENCTDTIDNNCNGLIDALDPAAVGCPAPVSDINLNPATLTIGSVLIGDALAQDAVIQNLGTAALVVGDIAPAGGTSTEFSFTIPGLPFAIPAGGSQIVTVTYQPVDAGTDNGSLVISSNDPDEPTVSLTFAGTGDVNPTPDIDVSPTTLSFTAVTIGNESPQTLFVQNLGTADVTISAINPCPETSAEFSWPQATPFTLQAKTAMTLSVIYAPVDEGADTGCLALSSDDPDEATVEVALQAEGVLSKPSILRFLSPVLNAAGRRDR
ncbi:MAG: choice-of-anchor D domain-containing protein [Desulfobulbaceae bacterium]